MVTQASDILQSTEWEQLNYHPEQARLWMSQSKRVAVRAGRGSGKSTICFRKLAMHLPIKTWHGSPGMYGYIAPTREQAKRIAWAKFKNLIPPRCRAGDPSETELIIRTIWGSELHVLGFDKPQRIEGVQWDGLIVDESADIKPHAVDLSALPALTVRKGFLWRIGVPKRGGLGASEFKQICEDRNKGYEYFGWSSVDFKHIPSEVIEEMRRTMAPEDFREQILGESVLSGGRAFASFAEGEGGNVSNSVAYDTTRPIIVGSDFNVNPMAWTLNHLVGSQLQTFDEIWMRDTNTRATLDTLHERYGDHKAGFIFIGDAAGKGRSTAATSAAPSDYSIISQDERFANPDTGEVAVRYPKANPSIKDRLASCNALLCNAAGERRWLISPSCVHLIDDLRDRVTDDSGQPTKAVGDVGHMADAAGYVVHKLFPINLNAAALHAIGGKGSDEVALSVVG